MLDFCRIDKTGFADGVLLRLDNAGANSCLIGTSGNHFILRNLRLDWRGFIDTPALTVGRMLKRGRVC